MPYTPRPQDELPDNHDFPVWRYVDFSQFVSIFERGKLWFSRSDKLDDPFEGSLTEPEQEQRDERLEALHEWAGDDMSRELDELIESDAEKKKRMREWVYVNCWHLNKRESAAMWRLYSKSEDAVAIKSTVDHLTDAIAPADPDINVTKIRYYDFQEDIRPTGASILPFMQKRKSFEHECELRVMYVDRPDSADAMDDQDPGHYVTIDLTTLVDEVRISPDAPGWLECLAKDVVDTYGFEKDIVGQSDLSDDVLF